MFLIYVLDFPTYMFDSEHKYAIDYGTLIALSDACSAPYLSLLYNDSYLHLSVTCNVYTYYIALS